MKKEIINKLSDLLEFADKTAIAAAYNLNTIGMRMPIDHFVEKEVDNEASHVKGAVNYILEAKALLKKVRDEQGEGQLVELWLVKDVSEHEDWISQIITWPLSHLPAAGDKIETFNFLKTLCPEIPEKFLHTDYYKVQYHFFEVNGDGKHYISIKLTDQWTKLD